MKRATFIGIALATASLVTSQANALSFVLTNTGGAGKGTQARAGFEIAAAYWSSIFTDDVTVNLNIGFRSLAPNILGSTGSASSLLSMAQGYGALFVDRSSRLDRIATNNLPFLKPSVVPGFGSVSAVTNDFNAAGDGYVDTATRLDDDGSINNSTLAVTQASAKALGLTTDVNGDAIDYTSIDGDITFSSDFSFDFNPSNGIDRNSFDFVGVAIHEIGHSLGFVSGVDVYDAFTAPGSDLTYPGGLEDFVVMNTLDLFRYSAPGTLDWSTQNTPYFSIDGGETQVFGDSLLSTGSDNGDGRQASHWKDSPAGVPQLGVMDPTSGNGQMQQVTALDLSAFDAIGWDVAIDTLANPNYRFTSANAFTMFSAVPEPATWLQMILGFGVIGTTLRRRRATTKVTVRFA